MKAINFFWHIIFSSTADHVTIKIKSNVNNKNKNKKDRTEVERG
jgi:hypothetical protein